MGYVVNSSLCGVNLSLPRLFTSIRKSGFIPGETSNTLLEFCSSNNRGLVLKFHLKIFDIYVGNRLNCVRCGNGN